MKFLRLCVGGIFGLGLIAALFVSRTVLLPVILALILTLILRPLHDGLRQVLKLPSSLSAFLIVTCVTTAIFGGGYFLTGPATKYRAELGKRHVQERLKATFSPIQEIHNEIVDVVEKVDTIAEEPLEKEKEKEKEKDAGGKEGSTAVKIEPNRDNDSVETTVTSPLNSASAGGAVNVQIKENAVTTFYTVLKDIGFHLLSTIVLLFFLLSHGEEMSVRMGEVRGTPELLTEIAHEVSGYLFSITAINVGLGLVIGISLWILGLPNPILWGVMAAMLNFIPYAGALIGAGIVTLVSAMEFQSLGMTLAGGGIYLGLSAIEGNIITPSLIGKRFEINPIIVFAWVLAWAAIWGLPGMLIALPLLIIFRIVCSKIPSLDRLERVITISSKP